MDNVVDINDAPKPRKKRAPRSPHAERPVLNCLKPFVPSEYQECRIFWSWACRHPFLRDHLLHIPNEGHRTVVAGFQLKAIGLRPGVSDYYLPVARGGFIGLWIEMKRRDGKRGSVAQDEWLARMKGQGHYASYAFGADEAIQIVRDYLGENLNGSV